MTSYITDWYVEEGYVEADYTADVTIASTVKATYASLALHANAVAMPTRVFPSAPSIFLHVNDIDKTEKIGHARIKISAFMPATKVSVGSNVIKMSANDANFFISFKLYEGNNEETVIDNSTIVKVGTLRLNIKPQYESLTQRAYVKANTQSLGIMLNMPKVTNRVFVDFSKISLKINSSMAQMDERRLVVKIDNVELDYPMYFDDTEEITHTSTKTKAVDDSTVVSILPLGKYSKSVTISGYTFDFDAIRSISFDKEVELVFKDNSTEMARFDLLNNPLSIDEVANNYYDVKMKVLI